MSVKVDVKWGLAPPQHGNAGTGGWLALLKQAMGRPGEWGSIEVTRSSVAGTSGYLRTVAESIGGQWEVRAVTAKHYAPAVFFRYLGPGL